MKLFHTIVLDKENHVTQRICSMEIITDHFSILSGPFSLTNYDFPLIAVTNNLDIAAHIYPKITAHLSLAIVDDLEKKDFLKGYSQSKAIFILGELIKMLAISFTAIDCHISSIELNKNDGFIDIICGLTKQSSFKAMGSFMCMLAIVDYLLFSRSLLLHRVNIVTNPKLQLASFTYASSLPISIS